MMKNKTTTQTKALYTLLAHVLRGNNSDMVHITNSGS